MNTQHTMYQFLKAVQGNWRNALWVGCSHTLCPYTKKNACEGYLLTFNPDGYPLIIPADTFRKNTGEAIDPEECCGQLSRQAFEAVFFQFIRWQFPYTLNCPLFILSRQGL